MFSSGKDLSVPEEILFTAFINSMHRTAESAGENEMQSHEKFSQSEARCQIQSGGQMLEIKQRRTGKDQQRADLLTLGSCLYFPLTLFCRTCWTRPFGPRFVGEMRRRHESGSLDHRRSERLFPGGRSSRKSMHGSFLLQTPRC